MVSLTRKKPKLFIGVDPGTSGGIAAISKEYAPVELVKMPATETDIVDWFLQRTTTYQCRAYIELVGGFMGEGGKNKASAHTMFKFGQNYGVLRAAMICAGIPFKTVPPRIWQKGVGVTGRKKTEFKSQFKNRLKSRAQELFPGIKITLNTSDALLIAYYGLYVS